MRFHICLYKNGNEVININDVTEITMYSSHIEILTCTNGYIYNFDEFDNFEVDKIND